MAMLRILTAALFVAGPACAADLPMSYEPETQSNLVMPVSRGVSHADRPTVDRCNGAIAEWAAQYNPVSISSTLREPVRGTADGQRSATLLVKIKYLRLVIDAFLLASIDKLPGWRCERRSGCG